MSDGPESDSFTCLQKDLPRFCLNCSYNLKGLSVNRCPECGRGFDPADGNTFRVSETRTSSPTAIAAMYALPLGMLLVVLHTAVSAGLAWTDRILVSLWQASGPFAWLANDGKPRLILIGSAISACVMTVWAILIVKTRLRKRGLAFHFCVAMLWYVSGCPSIYAGV